MSTMFLQLIDATVLVGDVRGFSPLAEQLGPVELGLALSRFYEHMGGIIERNHGRIVKFLGDSVLGVFVGPEHRPRALAAVHEAHRSRQPFLDENVGLKLPVLDYSVGAASGTVLAGELGTEKLRFYDVLGTPVNHAFRLASLAQGRDASNLVSAGTVDGVVGRPPAIEVDPAEIGREKLRLYKIG